MSPTLLSTLLAAGAVVLAAAVGAALGGGRRRKTDAAREPERPAAAPAPPSPEEEEAIGRVAREVAHEFNNVLAIISTTSEVLLMELDLPDAGGDEERLRSSLQQVHGAAQRGAQLARRLQEAGRRAAPAPKAGSGATDEAPSPR